MRSVFLLVTLFLSGVPASISIARDYGQYSDIDPATKNWVRGLTDKKGKSCCETADGHPAEYEWDVSSHGYRVLIDNGIPSRRKPSSKNRTGSDTPPFGTGGNGSSTEGRSITSGASCRALGAEVRKPFHG
jgi:hypothetical protein